MCWVIQWIVHLPLISIQEHQHVERWFFCQCFSLIPMLKDGFLSIMFFYYSFKVSVQLVILSHTILMWIKDLVRKSSYFEYWKIERIWAFYFRKVVKKLRADEGLQIINFEIRQVKISSLHIDIWNL